ncbi:QWRF motif-containing protein 3-like [Trifolium pratense]|uniref:QWRF motif-containing protein 3-like n=1 Tax=Trifolium pratense TaxID=57577 RepID=A0A2K3NQ50_TRIPR|nr:QWRF motif-containing protein 3-like [Trifolium pratense]
MKAQNTSPVKHRHHRNREVITSRFLPSPSTSSIESTEFHSPSSVIRKSSIRSSDEDNSNNRRYRITEEKDSVLRRQLWPSSAKNNNSGTLADHITEDRIIEQNEKNKHNNNKTSLNLSQKSYRRFENNETREIGGSARYTGKLTSRSSSMKKLNTNNASVIVPGRLSLDENAKLFKRNSSLTSSVDTESNDEGLVSPARKLVVEVPPRLMNDATLRRARRGTSDSNIGNLSGDSLKTMMKRTNSITGYKSSKSQWALSPGRSDFLSPVKAKGVEKLLNFGFDFFKSKKSLGLNSPVGFGNNEDVHKLRLFDNRLIQWRYVNAKSQVVNANISRQAQNNLICVWDGLTKFRNSVMKKKIQLAKEKLEMKIAFILYYQACLGVGHASVLDADMTPTLMLTLNNLKLLEAWGGLERQHVSTITATKECLHSAVCRVPLLEGAKVDVQFTSIAIRLASDLTASIKPILTSFSPAVDKTAAIVSELAKVVAQEKQLLEEFYELLHTISIFELQERSIKCNLIQFEGWQRKYQQKQ